MSEPAQTNRKAAFSVLAVAGLIVNTGLGLVTGFVVGLVMLDGLSADSWPYLAVGLGVPVMINAPIVLALAVTRPGTAGAAGWLVGTALGVASAVAVVFLMVSICG